MENRITTDGEEHQVFFERDWWDRHIYTGDEIHILKEPRLYRYDEPMIPIKKIQNLIKDLIKEYKCSQESADYYSTIGNEENRDYEVGRFNVYEEVIEDLKGLIKECDNNWS